MQIRLGYELIYDCPQPTPMLLMLKVHYTRVSDLVEPDHLVTSPAIPLHGYRDGFGNWCSRIVAPAGQTRLTTNAIIKDTGEPDVIAVDAPQHTLPDLHAEGFPREDAVELRSRKRAYAKTIPPALRRSFRSRRHPALRRLAASTAK